MLPMEKLLLISVAGLVMLNLWYEEGEEN